MFNIGLCIDSPENCIDSPGKYPGLPGGSVSEMVCRIAGNMEVSFVLPLLSLFLVFPPTPTDLKNYPRVERFTHEVSGHLPPLKNTTPPRTIRPPLVSGLPPESPLLADSPD